ncbi:MULTISPECIES: bifunctional aconitate hydratase 2/2-methylisocitrate dehydratase [unclassified Vibrio]|uniref:bifunctional aconitate hydratase 2/2-methylisocitrate dehydratase n=1 Tax=unclassified Vibrio TaxID=2614977 RepID=UPI0002E7BDC0|nr:MULTISPECIES: bifunctional aconitate hydratase 2/2-methylisocitrate dehydratase [unclassified Vibrio]ANP75658.1 bifunctional aconitate hydratase 2/2-methylisocitrate dehydratase [Vibrio crassostreae 9CS106]OCH51124.1 bifunctional aconitate hydratase 2/2-methylisocitrate dehydratase [Vibrio sp. ZF57]PMK84619.1 bifunctional aconitate hydratase 2/2-methylisocitrate dehydratase [Vibrio sp. 10N.261.52.E5]PML75837.1 bifunctional aconitate hydratase 2/2-methylisocitrate dehydratase [Vibrio sp. 10N.
MLEAYRKHVEERAAEGVVPKPLDAEQVAGLVELLKNPPQGEEEIILDLLENRIPPGVDEAAYVKAGFLTAITKGEVASPLVSKAKAAELLGTMQGGYNIESLVSLLDDAELAPIAVKALSHTLLMFDAFYDVEEKAKAGNAAAQQVLQSWADAEWFTAKDKVAEKITVKVFKVTGETNTDDLSPAPDAWSRPDIPVHAKAMLKMERDGITPDEQGSVGPIKQIEEMQKDGIPLAYVGDVVGTGSSRKSATNSVLWFMGEDIPFVPNKRTGGVCLGGKIAPIFYNTMEDSGALPIELNVQDMNMGDIIDIYPYEGVVHKNGSVISNFELSKVLLDEVRAGGRIPLIIGRGLTGRARDALGLAETDLFAKPIDPSASDKGYTLAQKMVGKACGVEGVRAGQYCEPKMTTVGSQDTTGPMTRDELKDLACLGFSADLVMQSFCHTSAYPKPVDVNTHHTLPDFIMNRAGVSLRPGDGVIHSWLNRMLLPDTVGTGGDSHTRFPLGISFPAGSGLVAFAAATGVMPLDMPESILVRFKGEMQPGITLRDLVHAIPLYGIKQGLLTVEKAGKINEFSGRVLEIEGVEHLSVEQAFELSDASAERSAAGCTVKLSEESISEYLNSNIVMLKWMIAEGYGDVRTIERRITAMEEWLANPELLSADSDAEYAHVIEIDLADIDQPILCAPNDPDDARLLSDVQGTEIQEVFIGSCMTNIGHFRAAGKMLEEFNGSLNTRLWVAPPTKMDKDQLTEEGYYGIFGRAGVRIETPGCSLCMGNQARVADASTVMSTSTRNFPNRLGNGANVYLASAELSAVGAILGRIPTKEEYLEYAEKINATAADTYRYLNFHKMGQYTEKADTVIFQEPA